MNSNTILKLFRNTTLALALSASVHLYAATPVDQVVAVVDNGAILQSDLNQAVAIVKQQLQSQNQTLPPEQILRKNVLEQLILREAQSEMVKRYGIQPPEAELNAAVLNYAKQQGFSSLTDFQQRLDAQRQGNYAALRAQIAEEISINQLRQQQVMSRIKVSERDIDNFLKSPQGQAALGYQVHLLHFRVAPKSASATTENVNDVAKQLRVGLLGNNDINTLNQKYANANVTVEGSDMGYRSLAEIPADLAARVSSLQVGQTSELIPAQDGIHVLKLIDRKADDKKAMITQYQTRHILIQPSEVVSPEDAKQKIEQIYQRLKQGADFSELAATYSNDPGSARDGGSLGWVAPGVMVPEFEKIMTETPAGQISVPFQTQYGWHILKVDNVRQVDMTQEYQRRMAKQILAERQYDTEVDGWMRELRANTYVDIKDPTLKDN
ncbi:peptidylprolyl isomerase [Acinetobacter qingfengensis]|uniref:Chaperone SurA n=1 Tax=Acinetobacter qingfengensis TaxID=1262585 RepID=A0A1E7RF54_9GAMM|nr:peptidylprolyl isomerase [Acinetobacter qingfengensis]KAA8735643.1 peptidylprolyl isomerase [Acinetobacter qingfengensis]OEY97951.1 peptidylprolyl isomerase [Acinetobacter qingfengensis]